ncbi:carbohydrate kinase family protein [Rhodoplanes elegans]|uniref:Carbohydrate kinase family protein n=1 Tax=Rhodoplanes elegans TaxID=29408 RepID=A0A327JWP7_9BRAD|nr:carbohydrate kinase family protein [Rhodoplanes elegans]MBK5959227.1 carbohydrate kinase family protein [Rhodoplanes elegans]RAI29903.1 carbohydrate kinase family protein [Rhodoplanes elegans]
MKALTVGGAMIDTIAIIESSRIERMAMSNADVSYLLMEEGRKTEALQISTHTGGGAVNAAVSMARLGFDVSTLVKLGQDNRAETILTTLEKQGVSTRWTKRDERAPTGASVLISSHDRNAAVFTFRGANTLLEPADLNDLAFAVDVVYIASLSGKSAEQFPDLIRRAKTQGAMVVTNPGVRQLSARAGPFQEALRMVDIVALNRSEASTLVPSLIAQFGEGGPKLPLGPGEERPDIDKRPLSGGGFDMSVVQFFRALISLGPKRVLLTDGSRGAYVATPDEIVFCPSVDCVVAGTAGAGDAFTSTYAAYEALGVAPVEALKAATLNAASVVGHVDTQAGLLRREELDSRIAATGAQFATRTWPLHFESPADDRGDLAAE